MSARQELDWNNLETLPTEEQIDILGEHLREYPWVVGLDGMAAVGKGTLVEALRRIFGPEFEAVETGKMYRGLTLYFMELGYTPESFNELPDNDLTGLLETFTLSFEKKEGNTHYIISHPSLESEIDVTDHLQDKEVNKMVTYVSRRDPIRDFLKEIQLTRLSEGRKVIEGRDIWQIAYDYVDVLIFVYADEETLVSREIKRQREQGREISDADAREIVLERNRQDMERERGKLLTPEAAKSSGLYDAVIDTSHLTPNEVVVAVLKVMARQPFFRDFVTNKRS